VRAETGKSLNGTEVRIAVQDRGLGIKPEELPHINVKLFTYEEVLSILRQSAEVKSFEAGNGPRGTCFGLILEWHVVRRKSFIDNGKSTLANCRSFDVE
jgi:signal transduction histidine kinase